jgi:CheY-like chemotaxis protein/HD-like signal output (HDOD) protein
VNDPPCPWPEIMANLLLVDSNELAHRALRGLLTRGSHRCSVAMDGDEAWKLLREFVAFDLVVLELNLPGEPGLHLLQRIRADSLIKSIPVIVYTTVNDQKMVKAILTVGVQNYLVKPFREDLLYKEIERALAGRWRSLHFEEERSFCAQMQLSAEELRRRREALEAELEPAGKFFASETSGPTPNTAELLRRVLEIEERAQEAGVWAVAEYMDAAKSRLEQGDLSPLRWVAGDFAWMGQLIFDHLHPGMLKPKGAAEEEERIAQEANRRAAWINANVDRDGPVVASGTFEAECDNLTACPVIDTVLAAFQMSADRSGSHLQQSIDLVVQDPGLACTVLAAANKLHHDEMTSIEDIAGAVSMMGSERVAALVRQIPTAREEAMLLPPLSWPQFWRFQVGVGRLAQATCEYLQFTNSTPVAYTAGLLHDIGRLTLLHLQPYAFEAIQRYSQDRRVPLAVAERRFLGCDTRTLGERLARRLGLPARCCAVIQLVDRPTEADPGEVGDLVCSVALARELCREHRVGYSGDLSGTVAPPIEQTKAWTAIRPRLFPGFRMKEFEIQVRRVCAELKQTLHG